MNEAEILKKQAHEISGFFQTLSPEEINRLNLKTRRKAVKDHRKFIKALKKDKCYLCKGMLNEFVLETPCLHWLLRPSGFDKKHFPRVYQKFDFFQIQSYLRWIANTEIVAANINDLEEEKNPSKVIEYTIKFKNLEWSFSCGNGDLVGHTLAFGAARHPHYHFQMKIDDRPFIDYGDFHIPLTDEDLFNLTVTLGLVERAGFAAGYGGGMQDLLSKAGPEKLLNVLRRADDDRNAAVEMSTFIEAEPGKGISGDEIALMFKKNKETGIPLAKLARELKNVGEVKTIISPGPRVPDQAGRKTGKRR
jgi:hypothetical protein